MGDVNQITYLKRHVPSISGPILEVGSKEYGSTSTFRDFYTEHEYVGADMEAGKGVDVVVDLTVGTGGLRKNHFALAICCSVLEHVRRPWVFAEHLTSLLRPGGILYVSVPWVWRYHPYPDDYYRFSWRGIMELFPGLAWSDIYQSTGLPDEFISIEANPMGAEATMTAVVKVSEEKRRKYLPQLMVNMLGRKIGV